MSIFVVNSSHGGEPLLSWWIRKTGRVIYLYKTVWTACLSHISKIWLRSSFMWHNTYKFKIMMLFSWNWRFIFDQWSLGFFKPVWLLPVFQIAWSTFQNTSFLIITIIFYICCSWSYRMEMQNTILLPFILRWCRTWIVSDVWGRVGVDYGSLFQDSRGKFSIKFIATRVTISLALSARMKENITS